MIELVVVVATISALAAILTPVVSKVLKKGDLVRLEGDLNVIEEGVYFYWVDTFEFPAKDLFFYKSCSELLWDFYFISGTCPV